MRQLVIQHGKIIANHQVGQRIHGLYPNSEIIEWAGPVPVPRENELLPDDPRTQQQKDADRDTAHLRERVARYPDPMRLLMLLHQDMKSGTTKFIEAMDRIDSENPPRSR